ncbi:MAG TPA: phosphopyruvate hydratase [Candidatus Moranbacteria bacterium]|nr:phosphopyruvate hydratase [Candidatus Moranbacteria bacterium]
MTKIEKIQAREILDSRGNPTLEVLVKLENNKSAKAGVPSGASTGANEALELRDNDENRYKGKGVLQAVKNVNEIISKELKGMDVEDQQMIDKKMIEIDGTENKSKLGANAIVGVSLAICRVASINKKMPLYKYIAETFGFQADKFKTNPMFNIVNGGGHADSGLSIQEFKLVPKNIKNYSEQLRAGSEIFHTLKKILTTDGYSIAVGDEGGFAPKLKSNSHALETINRAISEAGYQAGEEVFIAIDAAANSFYQEGEDEYLLEPENKKLSKKELVNLYDEWIDKYNIISVEDGLMEEDWEGWRMMNEKIGNKVMNIGDDLLVTNVERLKKSIKEKACNSVLIKPNQIGTLTETIACMKLAKENDMKTVISHRSGETTDDFIADLAVGAEADFIKTGSLSRGERICKYNRLLEISKELEK